MERYTGAAGSYRACSLATSTPAGSCCSTCRSVTRGDRAFGALAHQRAVLAGRATSRVPCRLGFGGQARAGLLQLGEDRSLGALANDLAVLDDGRDRVEVQRAVLHALAREANLEHAGIAGRIPLAVALLRAFLDQIPRGLFAGLVDTALAPRLRDHLRARALRRGQRRIAPRRGHRDLVQVRVEVALRPEGDRVPAAVGASAWLIRGRRERLRHAVALAEDDFYRARRV